MAAEKIVTILNEEGMHARPAGIFVKKASEFSSQIELRSGGVSKSAKSIMGLMSMGLTRGSQVTIFAQGQDEQAAVEALSALVARKFAAVEDASTAGSGSGV